MPRLSNGNWQDYTPGNPVVTNTPIAIAWWNGTYNDLGAALQDSLSRSGNGGMLAPFKLVDGSVSAPAFAFENESSTGFYRAGSGDMRVSILGADVFKWTGSAITGLQSLSVTGSTPNGNGLSGTASGSGSGVMGLGGTGASYGLCGTAGSSSGFGVGALGVSSGVALFAQSSATNVNVARFDGYLSMANATSPSASTAFSNVLTPKNFVKAWALLHTDGAGHITTSDGFNVSGVALAGATVTLTFASIFAGTNYAVIGTAGAASLGQPVVMLDGRAIGSCTFKMWDANAGSLYNLAVVTMDITILVMGPQ